MKVIDKDIDAYTVLDLVTRRAEVIHLSRMFPFLYDATKVDPENIALRDREEFVVGEILDDTIDLTLPTKLWKFIWCCGKVLTSRKLHGFRGTILKT